jgi:hypothetical protein
MQNANGETMASFLSSGDAAEEEPFRSIGGRQFTTDRDTRSFKDLVYLARWVNAADLTDDLNFQLGCSALLGPNASGKDGSTLVYGADLLVKWRPTDALRGWPFVVWQTEVSFRDFRADSFLVDRDGRSPCSTSAAGSSTSSRTSARTSSWVAGSGRCCRTGVSAS